jgi:solute:Na+ symporter, SSS family
MLLASIIIYFIITLSVGFYANKKISGGKDFMNAGRNLHPFINSFALFALWFGSETLFGASAEFAKGGLKSVIEDPMGGVLCLLLVGFFYSKKMYNLNMLTIGDLFEQRFGKKIEIFSSFLMILSFIGYISAQLLALAILLKVIIGTSMTLGILISAVVIIGYTILGGMLAVSLNDFMQSVIIIAGLFLMLDFLSFEAGGFTNILTSIPESHWNFLPEPTFTDTTNWFSSWAVLGLGSIVSQDIFQRVNCSRSAQAAYTSSIAGGLIYLFISSLPLLIIMGIKLVYPQYTEGDLQFSMPQMALDKLPLWINIIFFGSIVSAIMSTCSGAILAPASLLSENVLRPLFFEAINDKKLLFITRISIVVITTISIILALGSSKIYDLVGDASAFGLVSIFFPFTLALFYNYQNKVGAVASMILGSLTWISCKYIIQTEINPIFYGSLGAIIGILIGTIYKNYAKKSI